MDDDFVLHARKCITYLNSKLLDLMTFSLFLAQLFHPNLPNTDSGYGLWLMVLARHGSKTTSLGHHIAAVSSPSGTVLLARYSVPTQAQSLNPNHSSSRPARCCNGAARPNPEHPLRGLTCEQRAEERVQQLASVLAAVIRRLDKQEVAS